MKMNEHIEIEYKILLTKNIFEKILENYQQYIQKDYIQVNDYFIHPLLQNRRYSLRIRTKNDQYELTLKRPFRDARLETNVMLTKEEKDKFFAHEPLDNEITQILKDEHIPYEELQQQFSLTTHRYDIILPEGILSLDHSTYLDTEDYELEFEVENSEIGFKKFLEIIEPYGLTYQYNCLSKIQRVLRKYNA